MSCNIPGIPDRLHRNSRPEITDFSGDFNIYIRIKPEHFLFEKDENGENIVTISVNAFVTNLQSCNRDSLCLEPSDVLYNINADTSNDHYNNFGIVSLNIAKIFGEEFKHPAIDAIYRLGLLHSPGECMYPHSEISIYDSEDINKNNVKLGAATLKLAIRGFYSRILTIEKAPSQNNNENIDSEESISSTF